MWSHEKSHTFLSLVLWAINFITLKFFFLKWYVYLKPFFHFYHQKNIYFKKSITNKPTRKLGWKAQDCDNHFSPFGTICSLFCSSFLETQNSNIRAYSILNYRLVILSFFQVVPHQDPKEVHFSPILTTLPVHLRLQGLKYVWLVVQLEFVSISRYTYIILPSSVIILSTLLSKP